MHVRLRKSVCRIRPGLACTSAHWHLLLLADLGILLNPINADHLIVSKLAKVRGRFPGIMLSVTSFHCFFETDHPTESSPDADGSIDMRSLTQSRPIRANWPGILDERELQQGDCMGHGRCSSLKAFTENVCNCYKGLHQHIPFSHCQ